MALFNYTINHCRKLKGKKARLTNPPLAVIICFMLRQFIDGLIDLVYPKTCHACNKKLNGPSIDEVVCIACWQKIKKNTPPFCNSCGRSLVGKKSIKNTCVSCIKNPLSFDRAYSPCAYEGVIKELIRVFKYKNRDYLGATLAELMNNFIKENNFPIKLMDKIIPIPLSAAKLREREFNQSLILSEHISKNFGIEILTNQLLRSRNTRTQTELKDHRRFLNVKGAFSVKSSATLQNKNILLIDDVLTTGATASEAATVLKNSGANIVYCLTLAN